MSTVEIERQGAVAWVWLNRPDKLNTFDGDLIAELPCAVEEVDRDPATRAIVIAGRGRALSAGFDLIWLAGQAMTALNNGIPDVTGIVAPIENATRPTLCAIQGPAIGMGLILAIAADIRLVTEKALFSAPEVRIGLFTPHYLVTRLERLIGLAAAKEMCLTGDRMGGNEAHRLGLANRVVPADSLFAETQALAERIAALPAIAVQTSKAEFNLGPDADCAAWEQRQLQACWESPEREAAMLSFFTRGKNES